MHRRRLPLYHPPTNPLRTIVKVVLVGALLGLGFLMADDLRMRLFPPAPAVIITPTPGVSAP